MKNKERMDLLVKDLDKYLKSIGKRAGGIKVICPEDEYRFSGEDSGFVGKISFESSPTLYHIINFLDVAGDFSFAEKGQIAILEIFDNHGLWYETVDSCNVTVREL